MKQALVFMLLLSVLGAYQGDGPEYKLAEQLREYHVDVSGLYHSRGVSYEKKYVVPALLLRFLRAYGVNRKDSALLFYYHRDTTLHAWLIDGEGIMAHHEQSVSPQALINLENELKRSLWVDVPRVQQFLASRGESFPEGSGNPRPLAECVEQASRILFPSPIASRMSGLRHLVVCPVLNVSSFPLYILKPFDNNDCIVDRMSLTVISDFNNFFGNIRIKCDIKYMISADAPDEMCLDLQQGEAVFIPENPLVVGNPDLRNFCEKRLASIPGAERESRYAAHKFMADLLTGKQALKSTVVDRSSLAELLYFATHGWADTSDPLGKSFLALSSPRYTECGKWTAREIQSASLPDDSMVILSACQTGLGRVHEGGIIGLSRAFILAGARNVVMSLWSVDDRATAELMKFFVNELFVPQRFFPAENLRQAMLKYKKINPLPSRWGAFISMGTPYSPMLSVRTEARKNR